MPPKDATGDEGSYDSFLRGVAAEPGWAGEGAHDGQPVAFRPGETLLDRFVIHELASSGGMGAIYRALDRHTGLAVAVKAITLETANDRARFGREARCLAELDHPAIVRYVAHGATPDERPFLAMEWLEGEDLALRLARGPLEVQEALLLMRRVCEGLWAAHAREIVHRDIKPSNVFLVNGDPREAKLLDFGIARAKLRPETLTRSGVVLGTVGYMAPEQASGSDDLDVRADVFSLGCVYYECLTGRRAFTGKNAVAVLAKVLREEVPHLTEYKRELPPQLDDLICRMLAKESRGRPRDAMAVLRELDSIPETIGVAQDQPAPSSEVLTTREQRLASVILAQRVDDVAGSAGTLVSAGFEAELERATAVVARHGGEVLPLAQSALLITIMRPGSATDLAAQAAHCAIELRQELRMVQMAVATGRADRQARARLVGPAIDDAALLLERLRMTSSEPCIAVDEVTAGLLDSRFELNKKGTFYLLTTASDPDSVPARNLLGRATPFVGRDKELRMLECTLEECVADSAASAVLVTGPAGLGKSRLRHEFLARLKRSDVVSVLNARGDSIGSGSALGIVRQLVRRAAQIGADLSSLEQHLTLRGYLTSELACPFAERVSEFLGELVLVPSPDAPSAQLRAARNEPRVMADSILWALETWLSAECVRRPVVAAVEDLHWGDVSSVRFFEAAMTKLARLPFFVLALARPEVHEIFPRFWSSAPVQEIRLRQLSRGAAQKLVDSAVGNATSPVTVARILERGEGNPFYLEELVRQANQSGNVEVPGTMLAMVQARLEMLGPQTRRVLRAASIFGDVFWKGSIARLLGPDADADFGAILELLVKQEVIEPERASRFTGEAQFAFRHTLLRDAAYAMLTDVDRKVGHRLAADWLVAAGENEPQVVTDHLTRAGDRVAAIPWILRTAQALLDSGNVDTALATAERAIEYGASGPTRGLLRVIQAQALGWRGQGARGQELAMEAMELLPRGTAPWFLAAGSVAWSGAHHGNPMAIAHVLRSASAFSEGATPTGPFGFAMMLLIVGLAYSGEHAQVLPLLSALNAADRDTSEIDRAFLGWREIARFEVARAIDGSVGTALRHASDALPFFVEAGDKLGIAVATLHVGWTYAETGSFLAAEAKFVEAMGMSANIGTTYVHDNASCLMARCWARSGRPSEAIERAEDILSNAGGLLAGRARLAMAEARFRLGDLDEAARLATQVGDDCKFVRSIRAGALAILVEVELARHRILEALTLAEVGLAQCGAAVSYDLAILRLGRAEALRALGRRDEAELAICEAGQRVLEAAAEIDSNELRESFLTQLPAHRRILEMAALWAGEASRNETGVKPRS